MERQNSAAEASQETLISLQQLEPSPVESPLNLDKQLPNLPNEVPTPHHGVGTLGLSGFNNGHGTVYYLTRLQKYSTYAFSLFAAMHITNTSLLPLVTRSLPDADKYLLLTRPFYQSFPMEAALITAPLLTHVLAGLALRVHRRNATLKRYGASNLSVANRLQQRLRIWPGFSWQQLGGYALVGLVGGHAYVNRVVPLIHEGSSAGVGLQYVAHGFARHPFLAWSAQVALVGVTAGHVVWGWARWMGWVGAVDQKTARRRFWTINGVVAAVAGIWAAGGLGVVARGGLTTGWVGKGFDELYKTIPGVGVCM
ncbi:hypothetical protein VE02_08591 [Pseudogymnoascus sp. 03VT05]|nr:hypothetical protein VE02_08591 [Pseudogymnoascus sp. 03VT05]